MLFDSDPKRRVGRRDIGITNSQWFSRRHENRRHDKLCKNNSERRMKPETITHPKTPMTNNLRVSFRWFYVNAKDRAHDEPVHLTRFARHPVSRHRGALSFECLA